MERSLFKAQKQYSNAEWDLIGLIESGKMKLDDVREETLPEDLRKLNKEERKAAIEKKTAERKEIQRKIQELGEQRRQYLKAQSESSSPSGAQDSSLDSAMLAAIRKQAAAKSYKFKDR